MPSRLPARRWTEPVRAALDELIHRASDQRRVAALDWDETCIRGDISYALLDDLHRGSRDDLWGWYRAAYEADVLQAYKDLAVLLLAGRTPEEVVRWTCEVMARSVDAGTLAWVPEMSELVEVLHDAGWEVWVVSGSPEKVVAAVAATYGIPEARVIGMDAPLDAEGRYVGPLHEPVTWREGKPQLLERRAGRAPDLAIGDSEGDIRLLEAASNAVWIDRGDPRLRDAAKDRGWWRQEPWT